MIAILGAGKMGEALISGLLRAGRSPSDVVVVVRRTARADQLRETYGVEAVSAADAVKGADTLVITVKPQDMSVLLDEIAPHVPADRLVISVAAGIPTALIERRLGEVPVVRVMSNTPVHVDEAMSVISAGRHAGEEHLRRDRTVRQWPRVCVFSRRGDGRCRNFARHTQGHRARDGKSGRLRGRDHVAGYR